jgi:hypothetical protein
MGYTTVYNGSIKIKPALNKAEIYYLTKFSESRRQDYAAGPYALRGDLNPESRGEWGAVNTPPEGQPGLWCQWIPTDDGTMLVWDEGEKFYHAAEWMKYLIEHFLRPNGIAKGLPGFEDFTFDHVLDGDIEAQGEDADDRYKISVAGNEVRIHAGAVVYDQVSIAV